MYLNARYYDPVLARFVQADPSDPTGQGVGVNRYAYALNNPVSFLDLTGLAVDCMGCLDLGQPLPNLILGLEAPGSAFQLVSDDLVPHGGGAVDFQAQSVIASVVGPSKDNVQHIWAKGPDGNYYVLIWFDYDSSGPTQAQYQGVFHDQVVAETAAGLRAVGSQVETSLPLTSIGGQYTIRADIASQPKGSSMYILEVKTGKDPTFTDNQRIVYPLLMIGDHVYSDSPKIATFGFAPGALLPPTSVYVLYTAGPGTPRFIIPLLPEFAP